MGYDDNTPLTGVTGGGLPAEIWRETMARVHEGLPLRGLPLLVPEPFESQVAAADDGRPPPQGHAGTPPTPPTPPTAPEGVDNTVRSVFESVMRGLFGTY
jgi:penicillin-binding protein 1A